MRRRAVSLLVAVTAAVVLASGAALAMTAPTFVSKWGSFGTGNGQFFNPADVAVDASGNRYVADEGNNRVQKFDPHGNYVGQWRSISPSDVATDSSGNVYVAQYDEDRIVKYDPDGTFIGTFEGSSLSGRLDGPAAVYVDAEGFVYVADQINERFVKFASNGQIIRQWRSGSLQVFNFPTAIAADASGNVYVGDGSRILKFDPQGSYTGREWGGGGTGDGRFSQVGSLAVDTSGDLYASDIAGRIQKFDPLGRFLGKWGVIGTGDGMFNHPRGITFGPSGQLFVADSENHRIQEFALATPDSTPPTISIATPLDGAAYKIGEAVTVGYSCQDEAGGSGLASCSGTLADGAQLDTSAGALGPQTLEVDAADAAGNVASKAHSYSVIYGFVGFGAPLDADPALNKRKAGAGVPVKFGLGGDRGLDVFAAGSLSSREIACDTRSAVGPLERTVSNGGLHYDATAEQYVYNWKTDKAWSGTCRQLVVKLKDGTSHPLNFRFQ